MDIGVSAMGFYVQDLIPIQKKQRFICTLKRQTFRAGYAGKRHSAEFGIVMHRIDCISFIVRDSI